MLRSHWRRLGALLLLAVLVPILAHAADAALIRGDDGRGPTMPPIDPQYGVGGGGPDSADPDEFGIYACPSAPETRTPGKAGGRYSRERGAVPRALAEPKIHLALVLQRVFGGVIR